MRQADLDYPLGAHANPENVTRLRRALRDDGDGFLKTLMEYRESRLQETAETPSAMKAAMFDAAIMIYEDSAHQASLSRQPIDAQQEAGEKALKVFLRKMEQWSKQGGQLGLTVSERRIFDNAMMAYPELGFAVPPAEAHKDDTSYRRRFKIPVTVASAAIALATIGGTVAGEVALQRMPVKPGSSLVENGANTQGAGGTKNPDSDKEGVSNFERRSMQVGLGAVGGAVAAFFGIIAAAGIASLTAGEYQVITRKLGEATDALADVMDEKKLAELKRQVREPVILER